MREDDIRAIAEWVNAQGLVGAAENDLLNGFSERCRAAGRALDRALAIVDTLHPVYEGRAFRWRRGGNIDQGVLEFGSTAAGEAAENWRRSSFFHLLETGQGDLRRRLGFGDPTDFVGLGEFKAEGVTDYVAMVHRFDASSVIGRMDCFYSHWLSNDPEGFADTDLASLRRLVTGLALAIKSASLARIATTLAEVYLGQDAGRQVLSGRISRGVAERIGAVLWFSDLRDYTRISDRIAPDTIIPLLNDYSGAVISSVHAAGGHVLKLIGDGTLAIFRATNMEDACAAALRAEASLRESLNGLTERRAAAGEPVSQIYIGLHVGDVFYGNIGSEDRLDFTVVGPAVNEAGRIASMCRSADRDVLMSSAFVAAAPAERRADFVSVGRYALRGVDRAQELFTIDRGTG
jgi:adenylate cyclase